jgi:hypothetical protein
LQRLIETVLSVLTTVSGIEHPPARFLHSRALCISPCLLTYPLYFAVVALFEPFATSR